MRAGSIRELLSFQRRQTDAQGRSTGPFVEIFQQHARCVALKGSEPVIAKRLEGVQPIQFQTRYSANVASLTTADRIVWLRTGQVYNVTSVAIDEKLTKADIMAIVREGGTIG